MPELPVMLKLSGRRCLVVGGGKVAVRRAASLLEAGGKVTVVAPRVAIDDLTDGIELRRRTFEPADLDGMFLVVIATDQTDTNDAAEREARTRGVLVNRADAPQRSDLSIPAHAHHGPVTLAVHTSGVSATAAAAIRRELSDAFDRDWVRLLEVIAPYREPLQAAVPDAAKRNDMLRRLADHDALQLLKADGVDALRRRCAAIVEPHLGAEQPTP